MNRRQFAVALSRRTDLSESAAEAVLEQVFGLIAERLIAGEPVKVRKFGSFEPKRTKARQGRNPRTGIAVPIKAGASTRFKPSRDLRRDMTAALA